MSSPADKRRRRSGILLHVTSLPGPFGIGDLGPQAHAWVDALAAARQSSWQILPLTPLGYGNSPYQSSSAFAGNTLLISPQWLAERGWVPAEALPPTTHSPDVVDWEAARKLKAEVLKLAWKSFTGDGGHTLRPFFDQFCHDEAAWLDDYALFACLKELHGGASWVEWPPEYAAREPRALEHARRGFAREMEFQRFGQFVFFRQMAELKQYAHAHGVELLGDLPIFVAEDSADVWARPELFLLDERRRPAVVAGVPPDYFSQTGQRWGNPLYDWAAHRKTNYAWWIGRMRTALRHVDCLRLDHFRGFEAHWEIPADAPTAEVGRWVPGPGAEFLTALQQALGGLPLIAEDLGIITPEVDRLRERFELPGMCILQFAFGGATEARFLPHNHRRDMVVYTGTHDNDTTLGWFNSLTPAELDFFRRYVPGAEANPAEALIRLAWQSVGYLAIAPLQDLLALGTDARMNTPGTVTANWAWRFRQEALTPELLAGLASLTATYERAG